MHVRLSFSLYFKVFLKKINQKGYPKLIYNVMFREMKSKILCTRLSNSPIRTKIYCGKLLKHFKLLLEYWIGFSKHIRLTKLFGPWKRLAETFFCFKKSIRDSMILFFPRTPDLEESWNYYKCCWSEIQKNLIIPQKYFIIPVPYRNVAL